MSFETLTLADFVHFDVTSSNSTKSNPLSLSNPLSSNTNPPSKFKKNALKFASFSNGTCCNDFLNPMEQNRFCTWPTIAAFINDDNYLVKEQAHEIPKIKCCMDQILLWYFYNNKKYFKFSKSRQIITLDGFIHLLFTLSLNVNKFSLSEITGIFFSLIKLIGVEYHMD